MLVTVQSPTYTITPKVVICSQEYLPSLNILIKIERPQPPPEPRALIPFSRDPDFVSRGDILANVAAHCSKPAGRAALVGLGGVGKSQLGIEYAYQIRDAKKDSWVFWVHAGTKARVEEGFRAIADAVELPGRHKPKADVKQLLHAWLSNEKNGKWLMILDSADDQDVFFGKDGSGGSSQPLASYLPQSANGSILITTRDHAFAFRLTGDYKSVIKVGPMEPSEAFSFLEKKLGPIPDASLGAQLVEELDCIPLAINQAASYIQVRAPRCTIAKYLVEFRESEKKSAKLLAHDSAELRRDGSASNAIMKTWQISFDHIREKQPSAADLLSLMSFFDRQSIPEAALNIEDEYDSDCESDLASNGDCDELANQATLTRLLEAKASRDTVAEDSDSDSDLESVLESGFEEDIAVLRDYCLISARDTGTEFEMHRLVQLATKKWLTASKKKEEFKQLFISRIAMSMPSPDPSNELPLRDFFAHLQIATSYQPNKTNLRSWCKICYCTAWYQNYLGQCDAARGLIEQGLDAWKSRKGTEHRHYLIEKELLGSIFINMGEYQTAEIILEETLNTQKRILPIDSEDALSTMLWLSNCYALQMRYREAEELQLYVIEKQTARLGREDDETLEAMSFLASTYSREGRFEDAEKIELQILEISKRVLGPTHYETLVRTADLAETYHNEGRYDEAMELQLEALRLDSESSENSENQVYLRIKTQLALIYTSQLRYDKGQDLGGEMIDTFARKLGPDHEETLHCMQRMAQNLKGLGKFQEAENLLVVALERSKSRYGPFASVTTDCAMKLARLYKVQSQFNKGALVLSSLLACYSQEIGSHQEGAIELVLELASIHYCSRSFDESSKLFSRALAIFKGDRDVAFLSTFQIWKQMAGAHFKTQSQYLELRDLLREILCFNRQHYGADSIATITLMSSLATVNESLEEWSDAASLYSESIQSLKRKYGDRHPRTLQCMQNLALVLQEQGFIEEKGRLQAEMLKIRRETFGQNHVNTLTAMEELASTLAEQGDLDTAEALYRESVAGLETLFSRRHWRTILTLQGLAKTVGAQAEADRSRREESLEFCQEIMALTALQYGDDSAEAFNFMRVVYRVFRDLEEYTGAVELAQTVYVGYQRLYGDEHPDTMLSMRCVVNAWDASERFSKSVPLQGKCLEQHIRVLGAEHPDTLAVQELYEEWVDALESHREDDAQEPGHPANECEVCLADNLISSR